MDTKEQLKKVRAQIKALAVKADITDEENAEMKKLMAQAVKLEGQLEAVVLTAKADEEEKAEQEKAEQEKIDAAVKAEKVKWEAEAAKSRRLPMGDGAPAAPAQTQFAETYKYDHLSPGDLGLAIEFMHNTQYQKDGIAPPSAAFKALAIKLIEDKRDFGDPAKLGPVYSLTAMKAAGLPVDKDAYKENGSAFKAATDPMYTGGTTDGGNWVHTSYARELWQALRSPTSIVGKIPEQVIPDGYKSVTIPIEGTDLTWYTASEASSSDSTLKVPAATVAATQITTPTNKELTIAKMGARGLYSGEMTEDSILAFAPQLRKQLEISGAEQLEHAVIDGDSTTTAQTNINDIGNLSTVTAGTLFLMLDGFRKLALVTNTANSRAGGALSEDDYLDTMWLMGTAGLAGADLTKCAFIVDPNVYRSSLKLASLKTQDVWANATMESGILTKIWGYDLFPSWYMHYKSTVRKANSAGKVDQTTVGNNLYGAILGVRWDQWRFGYKRQMTVETTRIANADAWEVVAWARVGLAYRDTEASSVSYGITV